MLIPNQALVSLSCVLDHRYPLPTTRSWSRAETATGG